MAARIYRLNFQIKISTFEAVLRRNLYATSVTHIYMFYPSKRVYRIQYATKNAPD